MKAVIFDMDGLLIDSEPMWKSAEEQVFSALGVEVSDQLASFTASMTTREVTEFWFSHFPWQNRSLESVEKEVIERVGALIQQDGIAKRGVLQIIKMLKQHECKIGLATNAPQSLVPLVLEKLEIADYFDCTVSSSEVDQGKPNPDVYLLALDKLGVSATETLAFEDSASGLKAATAAKIRTIVVPGIQDFEDADFEEAELKIRHLEEFNAERFYKLCQPVTLS
ncbi:hexitol phosphatase HxpB [Methylophaga sp. OBS1]|uniref:hexitol phosphatase HxpB n=1 Tax=Methylophaga sp. OBS1 TaxID=2991933 RepID=UPI00225024E3|nr:hexitol phosphatase HxpB [Methylophaga sp. OBS1]MCX4193505.1 hexitol phosphatase HxpB [Methylophaga sp. OBS1]